MKDKLGREIKVNDIVYWELKRGNKCRMVYGTVNDIYRDRLDSDLATVYMIHTKENETCTLANGYYINLTFNVYDRQCYKVTI